MSAAFSYSKILTMPMGKKKKKERKGTRFQVEMTYFYCFTELKLVPDDLLTVTTYLLK